MTTRVFMSVMSVTMMVLVILVTLVLLVVVIVFRGGGRRVGGRVTRFGWTGCRRASTRASGTLFLNLVLTLEKLRIEHHLIAWTAPCGLCKTSGVARGDLTDELPHTVTN